VRADYTKPNARAKGRGRTKLGGTGQSTTPRPLERRVGRRTGKEWLLILAFRSFRRAQRKETRPTYLAVIKCNLTAYFQSSQVIEGFVDYASSLVGSAKPS